MNSISENVALVKAYNSMFGAIVEASDDAIISRTIEGKIIIWNAAATHLFGYQENEIVGKEISLLIPADRLRENAMIIGRIKRGEKVVHFETIRIAKDGSEKNVSITILPALDEHGKVIGASQIVRDITMKKFAEEKQATLAAIVSSSDDAIISKTLDGIVTSWNIAATHLFGYSEIEAIGRHISMIIPTDRLAEETMIIQNIRSGNKVDHFETVRMAKDGTSRDISLTVSPIKNSAGEIIGASKVARDISLRIEAEKQRKLFIDRLQELNEYKDEFMVMASHELKTPLTVISANLQVLKHMIQGDQNEPIVEKVIQKVFRMSELISNLLDVSKIQAGKLELNRSTFDLYPLVQDVVSNLQETTQCHKIHFANMNGSLAVSADYDRMEHVLTNLIGNAIKYSPDGGNIRIEVVKKENEIHVRVMDEGIGIPKEDLLNIFERFYRVRGSASSFSGSGIGLYLSAEIVKKHGGKIWAESELGKSTAVFFTVPADSNF